MYEIRKCTKDDLEQVMLLSGQWVAENITIGYENVKHTKTNLIKRLNDYFLIALLECEVVGYTFGDIREGNAGPVIKSEEKYLEIFEIYIHHKHRNKGLGKKLINEILKTAEKNNVTRSLVGSSNILWRETADFYKELGFDMWYIQMYR